jgi:hypothetical protein
MENVCRKRNQIRFIIRQLHREEKRSILLLSYTSGAFEKQCC